MPCCAPDTWHTCFPETNMRTHLLYLTNLCRKPFSPRYGPNEYVSPAGTVCADVCGSTAGNVTRREHSRINTDLECCETGWTPIAQGDVVRRIRCGMGEKTCAPAALVVSSDVKYDKYWFEISLNTSGAEDTNATRSR